MAYILEKFIVTIDEKGNEIKTKISNREIADFVHLHNHLNGLNVKHTPTQAIALEENEVYQDGQVVVDEEYYVKKEEEAKKKEAERIAQLNMTRGDFIEGLILAQGKDENDIIALIEQLPITDIEKKVYINRVKNALDFYRGYPVIDVLCQYLGLSTDQMTMFFETRDYHYLIPIVEENSAVEEEISGEEAS